MKEKLKEQKLFFVSCIFLLLLSFPFIKMMNKRQMIAGVPQLYLYVFVIWLVAIVVIGLIAESKNKHTH